MRLITFAYVLAVGGKADHPRNPIIQSIYRLSVDAVGEENRESLLVFLDNYS
jgi:hypothetical protein